MMEKIQAFFDDERTLYLSVVLIWLCTTLLMTTEGQELDNTTVLWRLIVSYVFFLAASAMATVSGKIFVFCLFIGFIPHTLIYIFNIDIDYWHRVTVVIFVCLVAGVVQETLRDIDLTE